MGSHRLLHRVGMTASYCSLDDAHRVDEMPDLECHAYRVCRAAENHRVFLHGCSRDCYSGTFASS